MKKQFKVLGLSLCAAMLFAGCSCSKEDDKVVVNVTEGDKAILSGLNEGTKSYTLQEIFDDLKEEYGNVTAGNKLVEIIADKVLTGDTWKTRYDAKVEEKLMELVESEDYADRNGNFDEKRLVMALKAELYDITSEDETVYGPVYDQEGNATYLTWNYEDYINKKVKLEVLQELLNEKYVYDEVFESKENILTSKDARVVEYIAISSEEDEAWQFLNDMVKELTATDSKLTLKDIETKWKEKLVAKIQKEFDKIGTSEDGDGSILDDFTGSYSYTADVGFEMKTKEIEKNEYYHDVVITSDSNDILYSTLVERIQSDNVLDEKAYKTKYINGSYYMVSPLAGSNITNNDIRITDTDNDLYYIVKVDVFADLKDVQDVEKDAKIYRAVEVLAENTSLVSDSLSYYLEQYKDEISVHDEDVYNYLKTQFADIFVD